MGQVLGAPESNHNITTFGHVQSLGLEHGQAAAEKRGWFTSLGSRLRSSMAGEAITGLHSTLKYV